MGINTEKGAIFKMYIIRLFFIDLLFIFSA